MSKFKRRIVFLPAFDKRSNDPKKNFGIGSVTCKMFLIGEKGIVQFVFYTDWNLPHVKQELDSRPKLHSISYPMASDIGYHSRKPIYEGQHSRECYLFKGEQCYYDGSGLYAEEFMKLLIEKGSKPVWKKMKEYYYGVFEKPNAEKTWNEAGFGQVLGAICGDEDVIKEPTNASVD